MKEEKSFSPISGYLMLVIVLVLLIFQVLGLFLMKMLWLITPLAFAIFLAIGFLVVNPNESAVMVLFGAYNGTAKKNEFSWANPFLTCKKISLRARNLDSARSK